MLRKQWEDCLHRGKGNGEEQVNDHQSCHRWIPQYPPPPSKYSSHTTIGEKNYSTCSFPTACFRKEAQHEQGIGKRNYHSHELRNEMRASRQHEEKCG